MYEVLNGRFRRSKCNTCLLKKYFKPDIIIPLFDKITPTYESNFGMCSFTAFAEPVQSCVVVGLTAADPEVYDTFASVFDAVIKDYHKMNPKREIFHPPSYFGGVADLECSTLDPNGEFIMATRVQINRNYPGYPFCSNLTPENRSEVEGKSKDALCSLTGDLEGTYYSIGSLSQDLRDDLAREHLLFDNSEQILEMNGVFRDWPNYRGMFVSHNKNLVAWVNGEDNLQLITAQRGGNLGEAYRQMVKVVKILETKLSFVKDDRLGHLTFCPSNVGTGLHATAHMNLPHLSSRKNFGAICEKLNLKAKDLQIIPMEGAGHLYAISNKRTAGLTEIEAVNEMISGVQELIRLEVEAAEGKDSTTSKCSVT